MEEIKQEWESFKKCTCRTFRDKCSDCMPQEEIADWWLKKLDLVVSKERERIVEIIDKSQGYKCVLPEIDHSLGEITLDDVGFVPADYGQIVFKRKLINLINTK